MIDEKRLAALRNNHDVSLSPEYVNQLADDIEKLLSVVRAARDVAECFPATEDIPDHAIVPLVMLDQALAPFRAEPGERGR